MTAPPVIEPEQKRRVENRQIRDVLREPGGQQHDDGENHRRRSDNRRAYEHRLGGRFEGIARTVVFLEQRLGRGEIRREAVVALDLLLDPGSLLDHRQLENRLRVVGDRPIGVDGDRHGPHSEKAKRDEAERKHGSGNHQRIKTCLADPVGNAHQADDAQAKPVGAEISRDQSGKDIERRAAFA